MRNIAGSVRAALKVFWVNLAILTTLLLAIEAFAFGYYSIRRTLSREDKVRTYVQAQVARMPKDGYPNPADQSWFAAYWKEFNDSTYGSAEWGSYTNYHRRPFRGKYINVDRSGRRVTWNEAPADTSGLIRLAFFGGSTAWGTGARDEFTIPSHISKLLAARYPHRFHVTNYGQDGYVNTQELITLLREIQMGRTPAVAVFYDGYNDIFSAMQAGTAGITMNEYNRVREFNILHPSRARDLYFEVLSRTNSFQLVQGIRESVWPQVVVADSLEGKDTEALAHDVVRVYANNLKVLSVIARQFGIGVQFYWQPAIFTKVPTTEMEATIIQNTPNFPPFYRQVQDTMRKDQSIVGHPNFRDISSLLDGSKTAFIDTIHVTELANEAIAREMVAGLKDELDRAVEIQLRKVQRPEN